MAVFRKHHENNYTVVSNSLLRDVNISNQAIGLMTKMLSLPEDWDFSVAGLAAISKDGETRITSSIEELKGAGYLTITPLREAGRIVDWRYDIYETPKVISAQVKKVVEEDIISSFDKTTPKTKADVVTEQESKSTIKKSEFLKKKEYYATVEEQILTYLNQKTNSSFRPCKTNNTLVRRLLQDNYTYEDLKEVVDFKCSEWINVAEMCQYLRPSTLFGDKFDAYLNAAKKAHNNTSSYECSTSENINTTPQIYSGKVYN